MRLDAVEELFQKQHARETLRSALNSIYASNGLAAASHMARFMPVTAMPCVSLSDLPEVLEASRCAESARIPAHCCEP